LEKEEMIMRIYNNSFAASLLGILGGVLIAAGVLGAVAGAYALLIVVPAGIALDIAAERVAKKKDAEKIVANSKYAYQRFLAQKTLEARNQVLRMNPDILPMVSKDIPQYLICPNCLTINMRATADECIYCHTPLNTETPYASPSMSDASETIQPAVKAERISTDATGFQTEAPMPPETTTNRRETDQDRETGKKTRLKSTMRFGG
jgi:hypothetical protein